jgi:hypothetical protein
MGLRPPTSQSDALLRAQLSGVDATLRAAFVNPDGSQINLPALVTKLKNHDARIAALETTVASLQTAVAALQAAAAPVQS